MVLYKANSLFLHKRHYFGILVPFYDTTQSNKAISWMRPDQGNYIILVEANNVSIETLRIKAVLFSPT